MPAATMRTAVPEIAAGIEGVLMWSRRQTRPGGLSSTVFTTLDSLAFLGPTRISDLAVRERVSQPAMTALVNRLEAAGLAERQADPSDGRAALVAVTKAGRDRIAAYRKDRTATLARRLDQLPADELAALRAALPALHTLTATTTDEEGTAR